MTLRNPIFFLACAVAVAGGLGAWLDRAEPEMLISSNDKHSFAPGKTTEAAAFHGVAATTHSAAAALEELQATSKHDADIPHSLTLDAQGNLLVDEGLRTLMDFFLALDGEKNLQQIRALFLAAAAMQCDPACVNAAAAIFDQYQAYLAAMETQQPALLDTDDLRSRLEAVTSLRYQLLGQELASGLFGYEEAYDMYRISQWEVRNDKNLSAEERQQQLDILRVSAPPGLQEREQENQQLQQARRLQQQLSTDTATLHAARIDLLGQEAADRLQQLDQQRAQWDQRYQQYRQELTTLQTSSISEQDQAQQLTALRQRHFSSVESARVAALDRINGAVQ